MSVLRVASLSLLTLGLLAPAALAKPPAPGAPGTKHTWAPADKHGFGTAKGLRSDVWFTLRKAELTEAYYPDLGTPSLRSLEFVVTDGTFVDRETGPGVRSSVKPLGGLTYRQTTRTARWVLRKTWIADPARPTVLAHVHFRSLTGKPLRVFALVDRRRATTATTTWARASRTSSWRTTTRWPHRWRRHPGCGGRRAGTRERPAIRGTTSRATATSTPRTTRCSPATSCRPHARR
jgi:glucoamylase